MRILLFGKQGQLGYEFYRTLPTLGEVTAYDLPEIDFTHLDTLKPLVLDARPDVVINAIAYTAVDRAETQVETARLVNAEAPGLLAQASAEVGAPFIHFSTDFVFDGTKGAPYVESDRPNPINVYGQSKLDGERAVLEVDGISLVLRTSWVYSLRQGGFVTKVLEWSRQQSVMRMVTYQVGSPTWARMLAEVVTQLVARGGSDLKSYLKVRQGLYHLAGEGAASRYDWAQAILKYDPHKESQTARELKPAQTADFPAAAQRPAFSALDCAKFCEVVALHLPPWKNALELAMQL
jgi:dTDP-4-dehydrorhamnose reductase